MNDYIFLSEVVSQSLEKKNTYGGYELFFCIKNSLYIRPGIAVQRGCLIISCGEWAFYRREAKHIQTC